MNDILLRIGIVLYFVLVALLARIFIEDTLWLLRRRRSREPGLNTVADADRYVAEIRTDRGPEDGENAAGWVHIRRSDRGPGRLTPLVHDETDMHTPRLRTTPLVLGLKSEPVKPVRTEPVFSVERTPIYDELCRDVRARRRALRWPTVEMRTLFDALVEKWRCSHCDSGDCAPCPGCSCECRLVAA